jgi:hypothetical protein
MPWKKVIILLYLISITIPALADTELENDTNSTIILSPIDSTNNQDAINQAIKSVSSGGTVYLNAGVYLIDGPIFLLRNVKLLGDKNAIIRVSSTSSQWFTGRTGLISCYDPKNIEIGGFQIDGNCDELPPKYNSNDQDPHDCGRAVFIIGSSGDFGEDVYIHDMEIYDCFSDGIHVRCCKNVKVSNIEESNCQHEGMYFCLVDTGLIEKINIAGITSDCLRIENSKNVLVDSGALVSYMGDHANGAHQGGENGIQIGDQGVSFGVGDPSKSKIIHTSNIEVRNIIFANGRMSVLLDAAGGDPSDNVYIHDVKTLKNEDLERIGIPVNIDFNHMPSKEMSENIFDNIFGLNNVEVVDTGRNNQTVSKMKIKVIQDENGRVAGGVKIGGYKNLINYRDHEYISSPNDVLFNYSIIKSHSLNLFSGNITHVDPKVNVTFYKNKVSIVLTAYVTWYNFKTNFIAGSKNQYEKTTHIFRDEINNAPEIWPELNVTEGTADEYRGPIKNYTLVRYQDDNLSKIVYRYNGTVTTHYLMLGLRHMDNESGIQYTNFTDADFWKGDLPNYGDSLYINGSNFDPKKLTVEAYNPYENKTVDIKYTLHKVDDQSSFDLETLLKLIIILLGILKLLKLI